MKNIFVGSLLGSLISYICFALLNNDKYQPFIEYVSVFFAGFIAGIFVRKNFFKIGVTAAFFMAMFSSVILLLVVKSCLNFEYFKEIAFIHAHRLVYYLPIAIFGSFSARLINKRVC